MYAAENFGAGGTYTEPEYDPLPQIVSPESEDREDYSDEPASDVPDVPDEAKDGKDIVNKDGAAVAEDTEDEISDKGKAGD